jgi:hypothetical protein
MIIFKKISVFITLLTVSIMAAAQEDQIEDLLKEKIIIENPVYKPVISLASGIINFHGDVKNNYLNPVIGNYGLKFNVSTFIDRKRYFKANFLMIYGQISANQRSLDDPERNLNFKTDLVDFGVNMEYSFGHIFKKRENIRPFISFGIENIQFTPKGDLYDAESSSYFYWNDGTIRNISQVESDTKASSVLHRDYTYETDLREREKMLYGLGTYSQNSFSIPVDAGLDFKISERVTCRLGSSLHFTFTDYMDNVSSKGTNVIGKKGNDFFSYNYFMLRLDLFSQPKVQVIEKLFAEMDYDNIMLDDEDGDFMLDPVDECPGTPYGVAVDTTGCPLDMDDDGIPDYLDEEPDTPKGAWVNEKGRILTEEEFLAKLSNRGNAMNREDVKMYFETVGKGYVRKVVEEIPEKFRHIDRDNDGYISFDELLKTIDDFFDYKIDLTAQDIYELNNFFFQQ